MKKVLIISYYWPPAGGITVLRTLKFVKYLRNFGWEPIVYAPKDADYPYYDENNFKDIPEGVITIRKKITEPFAAFKLLSGRKKDDPSNPVYAKKKSSIIDDFAIWIRGNFFIPDARSLWIKPSVRFLKKYLQENPVDAILTDGPPHTNTVIGLKLSKSLGIPWLADFQDPWTQVDYYKLMKITKWADKKHRKLEQETFRTAKKITIASPTWAKDLESIGAKNVDVIYYGYDEDDFKNIAATKQNIDGINIIHAGILGTDRNPEGFFEALKIFIQKYPEYKDKIKLKFAGIVDFTVKESIKKYGLEDNLVELGNIPRIEALKLMINSTIQLLPVNKAENAKGRLPGKLYEYLRAMKPVLALGPVDSDVASILNETGSGKTFEYTDVNSILEYLEGIIITKKFTPPDYEKIKKFDVKNQTKKVAEFLDNITS